MTGSELLIRIRTIAESLEPAPGISPDDPDIMKLKRALLSALGRLELENQQAEWPADPNPAEWSADSDEEPKDRRMGGQGSATRHKARSSAGICLEPPPRDIRK